MGSIAGNDDVEACKGNRGVPELFTERGRWLLLHVVQRLHNYLRDWQVLDRLIIRVNYLDMISSGSCQAYVMLIYAHL